QPAGWQVPGLMQPSERILLGIASAFVVAATLALMVAPAARAGGWSAAINPAPLLIVPLWAGCAAAALWVVRRRLPRHDPVLLPGCCGLYLQPAEILKLLLVVFLASYLSDRRQMLFESSGGPAGGRLPRRQILGYFLPLVVMWGFSALILFSQRDLGMSTLFFGVFIAMLYLASGRWEYVAAGLLLLGAAAVLGFYLFDVVRLRVEAWW